MAYDVTVDVVLSRDGIRTMDDAGFSVLNAIRMAGHITAVAKRLGMDEGQLIGAVHSMNIEAKAKLVEMSGSELELTSLGEEVHQEFLIKSNMVREQVRNLWQKPWLTTDGVVLIDDRIVLIRRGKEPFKGRYALPGGIVEYGERVEDCIVREVEEETGLRTEVLGLAGIFSEPKRDPRGHFITISYNLRLIGGELRAGDDADGAYLFPLDDLPDLAADHREIIETAIKARRG